MEVGYIGPSMPSDFAAARMVAQSLMVVHRAEVKEEKEALIEWKRKRITQGHKEKRANVESITY